MENFYLYTIPPNQLEIMRAAVSGNIGFLRTKTKEPSKAENILTSAKNIIPITKSISRCHTSMLRMIFYVGLFCVSLSANSQNRDSLIISKCIKRTQTDKPDNILGAVDTLLRMLTQNPERNYHTIFPALRLLFANSLKARSVVLALSKIENKEFDYELSEIGNDLKTIQYYLPFKILSTFIKSGSNLTFSTLMAASQKHIDAPTSELITLRLTVFKMLYKKYPLLTFTKCLDFYSVEFLGSAELQKSSEVATFLQTMIREVAADKFVLSEVSGTINNFITAAGLSRFSSTINDEFPLKLGKPGSEKFLVMEQIFNTLKTFPTPINLTMLAKFMQCDDPGIRNQSIQLNYSVVNNPLTFPLNKNLNPAFVKANIKGLNVDTSLLQNSLFIFPINFSNLLTFDSTNKLAAIFNGFSKRPMVEQLYASMSKDIMQRVAAKFRLKELPHAINITDFLNGPGLWKPQFSFNFLDFNALNNLLVTELSAEYQKQGHNKGISDSVSSVIIGKEMECQAIMVYNFARLKDRYKLFTRLAPEKINFKTLDSFITNLGNKIIKTELTSTLINHPAPIAAVHFKIVRINVLKRRISLSEGLYEETLDLAGANGEHSKITWTGVIPVFQVHMLLQYPRIYDLLDYSFASTDFAKIAGRLPFHKSLLNFIQLDPNTSLNYSMGYVSNIGGVWADFEEAIAAHAFRYYNEGPVEIAVKNKFALRPVMMVDAAPLKLAMPDDLDPRWRTSLAFGMPGGLVSFMGQQVCKSDSEYEKLRDGYLQPTLILLLNSSYRRLNEILRQYNLGLSDKEECKFPDFLCALDIVTNENESKKKAIEGNDKNIAICRKVENFLNAWDLNNVTINADTKIYIRQMLLNPDLTKFAAIYQISSGSNTKFVNLEGNLPALPAELKRIIKSDPLFLRKYNLDLAGSTVNEIQKLTTAVLSHNNLDYFSSTFHRVIEESGYQYARPLGIGIRNRALLFGSDVGSVYNAEITFLNELVGYGMGGDFTPDNTPTVAFTNSIKEYWRQAQQIIEANAAENSNALINRANAGKDDAGFMIGVTRDDQGNTQVRLDISVKGFNVRLSSTPELKDMQLGLSKNDEMPLVTFNMSKLFYKNNNNVNSVPDNNQPLDETKVLQNVIDAPTFTAAATGIHNPNFVSVSRSTAAASGTEPIIEYSLPQRWMNIHPLIGPGPWRESELSGGQQWVGTLITLAFSELTSKEIDILKKSANNGFFSDTLIKMLGRKVDIAREKEKVASGDWIPTTTPDGDIIPNEVNRNGKSVDEYVANFNAGSRKNFEETIKQKQLSCETKKVFDDGLPGLHLAYSKDYTHLMWTYEYRCVDGTSVKLYDISRVYVGFTPLIKANPNGHVLEKLMGIVAEGPLRTGDPENPLRRSEMRKIKEIEKVEKTAAFKEALSKGVKELQEGILTEHFDKFKEWLKNNSENKAGIEKPFIPSPEATPIMNFLPSPYDLYLRKRSNLEKTVNQCRNSDFGKGLAKGTIIIP